MLLMPYSICYGAVIQALTPVHLAAQTLAFRMYNLLCCTLLLGRLEAGSLQG